MVIVFLFLKTQVSEGHDHMCSKSFERGSWSWSSSFPFPPLTKLIRVALEVGLLIHND